MRMYGRVVVLCVVLGLVFSSVLAQEEPSALDRSAVEAALADPDWTVRLTALRALVHEAKPSDEALLIQASADPEPAVAALAFRALAELALPAGIEAMMQGLVAQEPGRREAAALALLMSGTEFDEDTLAQIRLQITTENGRQWQAAIETRAQVTAQVLSAKAALERHAALKLDKRMDPKCFDQLYNRYQVEAETFNQPLARFERFWREGRLGSLSMERERLEQSFKGLSALNDDIDALCWRDYKGVTPPDKPDPPSGGSGGFWASTIRPSNELYVMARTWLGHDNNTFILRPGLRVTEPARPETGQPIDLVRDDTLFGIFADVVWRYGFGETTLEQDTWRSFEERGSHVLVRLSGGYDGRLRWGQLMGPTGELEVTYDRFGSLDDSGNKSVFADITHLNVSARGGLSLPSWFHEFRVDAFPGRALGGELSAEFLVGKPPPGTHLLPLPQWGVRYHGDAYTYFGELGLEPPESFFSTHRLELVASAGAGADPAARRVGGLLDATVRLTEGGLTHGLAVSGKGLLMSYDVEGSLIEVELGYGLAVPFTMTGHTRRLDSPTGAVDTFDLELEHGPVGRGLFHWRSYDGDIFFDFLLSIERNLRPVGRYGWLATSDEGRVSFSIGGRSVSWFEVTLHGERANYEQGGELGENGLVAGGMLLEFPVFPMEPLLAAMRLDGRLVADDARFGGRLMGQFRIMLWVDLATGDLL